MTEYMQFHVIPQLPEKLSQLARIAGNLWMAWNPTAIKLFITMDSDLWERCQHNPVKMLGEITQDRLNELAADEGFIIELQRVAEMLDQYLQVAHSLQHQNKIRIAYFSAEYGLNDTIPIYSGGLGVLSGDHVKSASDLNLNFFGVGILYQQGYFQQYLNQDGWQQDFYQVNDFANMQVKEIKKENGDSLLIGIDLPGRALMLKVWQIEVGRVKLFMLDANVAENTPEDRQLTAQLYGGDREMRLQQEMILGIGGVRTLEKLGFEIDALHMNEGHSAFATFERCRQAMGRYKLSFREAMELVRKSSIFTTHTNVQAGHDVFSQELLKKYLSSYIKKLGITFEEFINFGRTNPDDAGESFSMTVAAIKNSSFINGVSKLQGHVSRTMWRNIWKDIPLEHVPIKSITNGVHIPSWLSFEMNNLYERYLGIQWREKQDYHDAWERVMNIPDPELWNVREIRRRRLISFTRQRLLKQLMARGASKQAIDDSQEALNPDVLTIGFARRFATYKRANLVLKDPQRLIELLSNPERPIQLIFAGKAHPQDQAGKELIRNIIHFKTAHGLLKKVVFIEDYDFNVARYMLEGVDLWLNTPLRPLEACGTSGMKAACNGALNFSILDGWWDEAYDRENGWAIGNRETYQDQEYQAEVESQALYSILENDIVPLFYQRSSDGLPRGWIKMIKHSLMTVASKYNSHRMVKEYFYRFYKKAGENINQLRAENFRELKSFVTWKERICSDFMQVKIIEVNADLNRTYKVGEEISIEAEVILGGLNPEEVRVDVYYGRLLGSREIADSAIETLTDSKESGEGKYRFSGSIVSRDTGSFGMKIRITPYHPHMFFPYELNCVIWK